MKLTIYWKTKDKECIERIRELFSLPPYMTINGETQADIKDEDMEILKETASKGFIEIRHKHVL